MKVRTDLGFSIVPQRGEPISVSDSAFTFRSAQIAARNCPFNGSAGGVSAAAAAANMTASMLERSRHRMRNSTVLIISGRAADPAISGQPDSRAERPGGLRGEMNMG